jgi:hypothetical protein
VANAAGVAWTEAQAAELWRLCIACLQLPARARPSALDVYAALQALLPPDVPAPPMDFAAGVAEEDGEEHTDGGSGGSAAMTVSCDHDDGGAAAFLSMLSSSDAVASGAFSAALAAMSFSDITPAEDGA